jgi:hypothetical protein
MADLSSNDSFKAAIGGFTDKGGRERTRVFRDPGTGQRAFVAHYLHFETWKHHGAELKMERFVQYPLSDTDSCGEKQTTTIRPVSVDDFKDQTYGFFADLVAKVMESKAARSRQAPGNEDEGEDEESSLRP